MDVLTYSDARANLKSVMDRIVDDHAEVVVTRKSAGAVVMVSLDDWNSIQETMHLLSSPRNADRLRAAVRVLDAGGGTGRELIEG